MIDLFSGFQNISESKLFYSPNFKNILKEIGSKEAIHILDLEGEDFDGDITLIDINKEGQLTYNTERNFKKNWPDLWELYFNQKLPPRRNNKISDIAPEVFKDDNRGVIGLYKFINKIYPKIEPKSLFDLMNSIKSIIEGDEYKIRIVEGEEILKWYQLKNCKGDLDNYTKQKNVGGTLGSSCMMGKSDKYPGILDLYTKNPDVCKLVIMLDSNNELVARSILWKALIWENKELKEVFLQDRVYYTQDFLGIKLINWAKKQGYYHKSIYTSSEIYKNGVIVDKNFKVKVKKLYYKKFPYLDTFTFYNVKNGELSNFQPKSGFALQSVSGDFMEVGNFGSSLRNRGVNWIRRFNEYKSTDDSF